MKSRKWVLVLAVIAAVVIFGSYFGWRITRANEKIRQLLLMRIRPYLSQESDIEKLEVDLSSVHLRGVKIVPQNRSFSLEIEDVRLGFKLWNLLIFGFAPYKLTSQIVFVHPTVVIRKDKAIPEINTGIDGWRDFHEWVEKLREINRITVADAEVILADSVGNRVRLAHSMNGWLQTNPADSASVRLAGNIFSTEENNLTLDGKLNFFTGQPLRLEIKMKESEPSPELPFILPSYIQVTSGMMSGELRYNRQEKASGFVNIRDGKFSFRNDGLSFEGLNLDGTIEKNDLYLTGFVEKFNGSRLELSGKINDILSPDFDLNVQCKRFDIPAFLGRAIPESQTPVKGWAKLELKLIGSLHNPVLTGEFRSSSLEAYGIDFDWFAANIGLQDSVLVLNGRGIEKDGLGLAMNGSVNFTDSLRSTDLNMKVQGNLRHYFPSWSREIIKSCDGNWEIQVDGGLRSLKGEARGLFTLTNNEEQVLRIDQYLRYQNRILDILLQSNGKFRMSGKIESPFTDNIHWYMTAEGLELLMSPFFKEDFTETIHDLSIIGNLSGQNKNWMMDLDCSNVPEQDTVRICQLHLFSEKQSLKQDRIKLDGVCFGTEGDSLKLTGTGTLNPEWLRVEQVSVGDMVFLKGEYPFNRSKKIEGQIQLTDFSLEKLHSIFPRLKSYFGDIEGGVTISGTRQNPKIASRLRLEDGVFHSISGFKGQFNTYWENRQFQSCVFDLTKDNITYLKGEARRTNDRGVAGKFTGDPFDMRELSVALTGREYITGMGRVGVEVSGETKTPVLRGSLEASDGKIGRIRFSEFQTELVDTLWKETGITDGSLSIQKCRLDRDDGLSVLAWGSVPHRVEREADVSVLMQGNILGVLPEVSNVFLRAEGSGEVFFRWAVRAGEWVPGGVRIHLENGKIQLSTFVDKIEKLTGDIELIQGERFVQIKNITGEAAKGTFVINNLPVPENSRKVVPLMDDQFRFNFGVLRLKTGKKGIRLHLPGFMEEGEVGWIDFGGREDEEYFIFAGPNEHPLFRGTLTLRDNHITYPLLKVAGDKGTESIIDFFESVNWDIDIVPQKDVHYVRDINMPLGTVDVDLILRDKLGKIQLEGVIEDRSLRIWGNLVSTDGTVDVLGHYFRPERITFDYPKGSRTPLIAGRASTTVIDSLGMHSTVWLSLASVDTETGLEKKEGPWRTVQFRFSTDNPNLGRTEADLLAALGYSSESFTDRAYDALGMQVENMFFRPIFRPLEREIRRHLGLDVVRFSSMFSRNLVQMQTSNIVVFDPKFLLRSTKLVLGKYLAPGLFLLYSGQVQNNIGFQYLNYGLGVRHALMLEYAIRPDLLLQMEYTYDSQLLSDRREDKKIWLKHVFPF